MWGKPWYIEHKYRTVVWLNEKVIRKEDAFSGLQKAAFLHVRGGGVIGYELHPVGPTGMILSNPD